MLTLLVLGSQASLRGDAVMSRACPALEAHSLKPCDRCLSHDLCPVVDGVAWSCDWISKRCAHPSWVADGNADEVGRRCNESDAVPSTWGAKCKKRCDEQIAPFSCAPGNCLNSDFPCRWVEGCMPPLGMFPMTVACLSSCVDYDELLNEMLGFETCYKAVETRGCDTGIYLKHERISDYCPVSCGSSQCQHRCSRDEVPSEDGKQCWQKVQHEKLLCGEAVRLGFDCHCVCGYDYLVASSSRNGGAFYKGERFAGVKFALEVAAVSRHPKTISLMGADMNKKSISGPDGPRMKIVGENELCGIANIINNVMGIDCGRAADQLAGSVCETPPSFATAFTHQWADVSFGDCGTFQICHCNQQCTERQNWRSIGTVVVEAAPSENEHTGGVLRSFPACGQDFDLSSFKIGTLGTVPLEKRVQTTITASLSISGGLQPLGSILQAIRATLVKILAVESPMLGVTIPLEEDVMVRSLDGRRLEEEDDDRRLQSGCFDDDAVFAEMARKIGLPLSSCTEVLSTVDTSELCGDAIIADAVWKGCRQTCGLCTYVPPTTVRTTRPPLLTTSTETTTTEDGNTTTTVVPTTTTTVSCLDCHTYFRPGSAEGDNMARRSRCPQTRCRGGRRFGPRGAAPRGAARGAARGSRCLRAGLARGAEQVFSQTWPAPGPPLALGRGGPDEALGCRRWRRWRRQRLAGLGRGGIRCGRARFGRSLRRRLVGLPAEPLHRRAPRRCRRRCCAASGRRALLPALLLPALLLPAGRDAAAARWWRVGGAEAQGTSRSCLGRAES